MPEYITKACCPLLLLLVCCSMSVADGALPGEVTDWHGFAMHTFPLEGRTCRVAVPKAAAPGKPWIWRARFWGHEPQTDLALLAEGFHVAHIDITDLFGGPEAMRLGDALYAFLTQQHGFSPKPALEGMSRGGLFVYNWAASHPDKVACIYADAPVLDIRSWPGGLGAGQGSPEAWVKCLAAYGLDAETVLGFKGNPLDRLAPLAEAGVPVFHVCGDADEVVPYAENTAVLKERYRALGGSFAEVLKPGVGHHPHSLADPGVIVDFILRHTVDTGDYFYLRSGLDRCRLRFERDKVGRVAFLGGSITHNPGWRPMVIEHLQSRFPETQFEFISAGIPSMGSTPGAFRLERDVLSQGKVDLLFQEAAVNDSTNGYPDTECVRAMEGIVRHARRANPAMDVVFLYFVDPDKMASYRRGEVPPVIVSHERVAKHYGVPGIHLAREVTERIDAGEAVAIVPSELHLRQGDSLTIVNGDDRQHEIGVFSVRSGETVSYTFPNKGTFVGACTLHSGGGVTIYVE